MLAEWVAMLYLLSKGYVPKKWRYKTPYAEIDWLCAKGNLLVVVEVKFRARWDHAPAIGFTQQQRLRRACDWAVRQFRYPAGRVDGVVLSFIRRPMHYRGLW